MIKRALLAASLCAGWAVHGIHLAHAQSHAYPNRPIKMVVPFPAGGPTDGMARIISDRLGAVLGQTIVVENHGGGAGGSVGAKAVAAADPDGYTLLITPGGALTTGPAVHKSIGYDPAKVFTPVGLLIETPLIISVHPNLPVKSLAEVVAYAKANPGKISWGSQGFGTAPHLLAEAPAGTPPAIIDKLNAAFRDSIAQPETRVLLANLGAEIKIGTPAEFGKLLANELARWTAVVKAANIKVE